ISMSLLRERMIEDMQLHGLSANTQDVYVRAVCQLSDYVNTVLAKITEEDLRRYFLYLAKEKKCSRSTSTIALCGIKLFFERTLGRDWPILDLVRPGKERKLPVVLSRQEVHQVLSCPPSQFAHRLAPMRQPIGPAADSNLFIDTAAAGHLLSAPRGLAHFLDVSAAFKPMSWCSIRSTLPMTRTKTIPAPWRRFVRRCCDCATPLKRPSSSFITSASPSAGTKSAAPSAAPVPFTPSAILISCSLAPHL